MGSNITISKTGFTEVTVHTISVKENHINTIKSFDRPRTAATYTDSPLKYILDFLMITRTIEIMGFISTEQDGSTPATTLKDRLESIFNGGGANVSFRNGGSATSPEWYGQAFGAIGVMTGLEFRESPADNSTTRFFTVICSLLIGETK